MNTAMVLCAGFGTRLLDLTKEKPKAMLPINGRPLLEYTISNLAGAGVDRLIINLHYLAEQITRYFGDGSDFGVTISYSYEEEPLGTSGALKKAQSLLESEDQFLVIYGDILTNQDYRKLISAHNETEAIGTITLHRRSSSNSIVEMDESRRIINFIERPNEKKAEEYISPFWVNSGLYCFQSSVFDFIGREGFSDFPKDIFPEIIRQGKLYGYPLEGYRCAIDSPERYKKVCDDVKKGIVF